GDVRVRVSRLEEELGGESYTLRTVQELRARRPADELALVIGADLVAERERWHGWAELKTLVPFVVVGRQGQGDAGGVQLPPISSREGGARVGKGQPIEGLVPAEVADYIAARGLYR